MISSQTSVNCCSFDYKIIFLWTAIGAAACVNMQTIVTNVQLIWNVSTRVYLEDNFIFNITVSLKGRTLSFLVPLNTFCVCYFCSYFETSFYEEMSYLNSIYKKTLPLVINVFLTLIADVKNILLPFKTFVLIVLMKTDLKIDL